MPFIISWVTPTLFKQSAPRDFVFQGTLMIGFALMFASGALKKFFGDPAASLDYFWGAPLGAFVYAWLNG